MPAISSINVIEDTCFHPWRVAMDPFPITEQVFYIGNRWVGAYLIDSGNGLILLDTTTAETGYQVLDAIHRLNRDPRDIRMILLSHAHVDHYAMASHLQAMSGAEIWLSQVDDDFRKTPGAREVGGLDTSFRDYEFTVDRHYDDSTPITLGNVSIETRLTPGHTPGTTSFFIHVPDRDNGSLTLAMHGGVGVLTMSDESLARAGLPQTLRSQFIFDCIDMKSILVDICLPSHPAHFPPFFKIAEANDWAGGNPFVDKTGWPSFLDSRRKFAEELEAQSKSKL